ncbi:hypothetical protein, partial [Pseudomonas sp. GW460-12]|uniref:hypothetical protein n=1 Tax=Pseudomonas sp. GW460-12 TaxID=2070621 RepID=UPI001A91FA97
MFASLLILNDPNFAGMVARSHRCNLPKQRFFQRFIVNHGGDWYENGTRFQGAAISLFRIGQVGRSCS